MFVFLQHIIADYFKLGDWGGESRLVTYLSLINFFTYALFFEKFVHFSKELFFKKRHLQTN